MPRDKARNNSKYGAAGIDSATRIQFVKEKLESLKLLSIIEPFCRHSTASRKKQDGHSK